MLRVRLPFGLSFGRSSLAMIAGTYKDICPDSASPPHH
jgi:hypothetical protein